MAEDAGSIQVQSLWRRTCIEPASLVVTRTLLYRSRRETPLLFCTGSAIKIKHLVNKPYLRIIVRSTGQYATAEVGRAKILICHQIMGIWKIIIKAGKLHLEIILKVSLMLLFSHSKVCWYNYLRRPEKRTNNISVLLFKYDWRKWFGKLCSSFKMIVPNTYTTVKLSLKMILSCIALSFKTMNTNFLDTVVSFDSRPLIVHRSTTKKGIALFTNTATRCVFSDR